MLAQPFIERIIIFGVGAAGSNVLLNLIATNRNLEFSIVDCDVVEERNLRPGTQPYGRSDLGKPKVQALQRICLLHHAKKINVVHRKITSFDDLFEFHKATKTLAIDAFDNARSRNLLSAHFHPMEYQLVHVGFSGKLTGEVCWDEQWEPMQETKADAQVDVCELALARPFIQMLTGAAAIVISDFIETGKKQNVQCDRWLNMRKI